MKKISFAVVPALLLMVLCANSYAQSFNGNKNLYQFSIPAAKSFAEEKPPPKVRQYLNSINIRAVRGFMKRHVNVDNESWVVMDDGGFKVNFIANGINNNEYYNIHGNWTNSLKTYAEAQLPFKIRDMVKREYYDYTIAHIYEIENIKSSNNPTYAICLEDEHSFVFIRIRDGEMDVWKKIEKQE